MKKINILKCERCDYEWIARVEDPVECPKCKSRSYKNKRKKH